MMRVTPKLEIARMVSALLNGREEIWRSHAQYVATENFLMLEGFEDRIQAQLKHIMSTVQLRGTEQQQIDEITAAIAALSQSTPPSTPIPAEA
jgi:hypothetical protein